MVRVCVNDQGRFGLLLSTPRVGWLIGGEKGLTWTNSEVIPTVIPEFRIIGLQGAV